MLSQVVSAFAELITAELPVDCFYLDMNILFQGVPCMVPGIRKGLLQSLLFVTVASNRGLRVLGARGWAGGSQQGVGGGHYKATLHVMKMMKLDQQFNVYNSYFPSDQYFWTFVWHYVTYTVLVHCKMH